MEEISRMINKIINDKDFSFVELEKMDSIISTHPFKYPDWDISLIWEFSKVDTEQIIKILSKIFKKDEMVFIYFNKYELGILIKASHFITKLEELLSIDSKLILFDLSSNKGMKIEKYLNSIELNVTENGWEIN
ncbi:MAG: hypothetical protein ACXWDO_00100 [Bacteroidia bacterium]